MKKNILLFVLAILFIPIMTYAEEIPNLVCAYTPMYSNNSPIMFIQYKENNGISNIIKYAESPNGMNKGVTPTKNWDKWLQHDTVTRNFSGISAQNKNSYIGSATFYTDEGDPSIFQYLKKCPPYAQSNSERNTIYFHDNTDSDDSKDGWTSYMQSYDDPNTGLPWKFDEVMTLNPETSTEEEIMEKTDWTGSCDYTFDISGIRIKTTIYFNDRDSLIRDTGSFVIKDPSYEFVIKHQWGVDQEYEFKKLYKEYNACPKVVANRTNDSNGIQYVTWSLSIEENVVPSIKDPTVNIESTCDALLGEFMTSILNNIFSTIQYLGPILVIVLSIADFAKAAISGEASDMKKAQEKLVKRGICAILLFFVPLLCKTLFSIAGVTVPDVCIGE